MDKNKYINMYLFDLKNGDWAQSPILNPILYIFLLIIFLSKKY